MHRIQCAASETHVYRNTIARFLDSAKKEYPQISYKTIAILPPLFYRIFMC